MHHCNDTTGRLRPRASQPVGAHSSYPHLSAIASALLLVSAAFPSNHPQCPDPPAQCPPAQQALLLCVDSEQRRQQRQWQWRRHSEKRRRPSSFLEPRYHRHDKIDPEPIFFFCYCCWCWCWCCCFSAFSFFFFFFFFFLLFLWASPSAVAFLVRSRCFECKKSGSCEGKEVARSTGSRRQRGMQ